MSQTDSTDVLLERAYNLITEGLSAEARATLEHLQPETPQQKLEAAYLQAWSHTLDSHWDAAAKFLLDPEITQEQVGDMQSLGQTERRRRAWYLLLLGDIALNLGRYEEGKEHYTQCIKFLDERRMNIMNVRIRARYGLGTAYTQTGFYAVALTHYKDALNLCGEDSGHTSLPDIYYGFCDTYRRLGNFDDAIKYGKKALQIYVDLNVKHMEGRIRALLGRISFQQRDYQAASYYLTEALALATATNRPGVIITNLTALADVRLAEGLLDEARRYCQHALEYRDRVAIKQLVGMLYIVCGKVAEAEFERADGARAEELHAEAASWYKQAIEVLSQLQARVELREVYGRLAQLLERSNKQDEAFGYWKAAYSVYNPA
jgi:tetratricopeptide (TPR) repeat protein